MPMFSKEPIDTNPVSVAGLLPAMYEASQLMQGGNTDFDLQGLDCVVVEPEWQRFAPALPAEASQRELAETRVALRQAEHVLRVQEERIRVLEAMALTDELTGLANRRGFAASFQRELTLARRDAGECGFLVMVDLDGFKAINDRLGHQAGDAYLSAAALALQEGVRASDIVARVGGDEFAVLFTRMDEDYAAARLAKLERFFGARAMIWNGKRIALRASFGAAVYNGSSTAEAVVHMADTRLYAHKAYHKKMFGGIS